MRVQTVVRLYEAGTGTCDGCHSWYKRLEVTLNGESAGSYCLDCVAKQPFSIEQEVKLEYGKKQRKRTQKKAKKSEEKTAQETGGYCTGYIPSSGDSRNSRFFFEDKTRIGGDRKSYTLTQETMVKGRDQARRAGLIPVIRVHLKDVSIGAMIWDDLLSLVYEEGND